MVFLMGSETEDASDFSVETQRGHNKRRYSDRFNPVDILADTVNMETSPNSPNSNTSENADASMKETESVQHKVQPRRSLRKRIRTNIPSTARDMSKPIKLNENSSIKDVTKYYLDKKVKRLNPSLETIYEEPQTVDNEDVIMSSRKFRRVIDFNVTTARNNVKVRKRKVKAKNMKSNKKMKKVSIELLMEKLSEVDED